MELVGEEGGEVDGDGASMAVGADDRDSHDGAIGSRHDVIGLGEKEFARAGVGGQDGQESGGGVEQECAGGIGQEEVEDSVVEHGRIVEDGHRGK